MKTIAIDENMHQGIKKFSKKTGIMIYRLMLNSIEYLERKYEVSNEETL